MAIPLLALLIILAQGRIQAQDHPSTYLQLVATRYSLGDQLPVDAGRPEDRFEYVESAKLPAGAKVLSAARTKSGLVWIVTDRGVFRQENGAVAPLELPHSYKPWQPQVDDDTFITAVTNDADGHIWAATTRGLYITDGDQWWQVIDRRDGMPYEEMTTLCIAPNGDVWGGTPEGAWRLRNGHFRYFWGKRWLPGNRVSKIWTDRQGRVWLDTDQGSACIEERPMTLAKKAVYFDAITQQQNNRHGYINELLLNHPGDQKGGGVFEISDNDGLWNSIYVGAMCFRYAATHDPAAKREAKQALTAMMDLERLTGIPGYPARAVVTDAELKAGAQGVDMNETVRVPGETEKIWFRSPVQKDVWCKGDTSSDELDGHYFAYCLYYDLVADPEEKREVAGIVQRITDHIIAHDYTLVGHTGRKTLWGVWAPRYLNDDPKWWPERSLNSLELLDYLQVAYHVTGDRKYKQHYDDLVQKHHYLLNGLLFRRGEIGRWEHINHSDDELAYLVYYPLITLEKDPVRHALLAEGLARTWEDSPGEQTIKAEHSPLYNFIYGAITGRSCAAEDAIQALEDWPWDRIEWTVHNSQRYDVTIKRSEGGSGRNPVELTRVLPISERCLDRWNSDVWEPDGGNDGRALDDGAAWLLPYWMGVYHGYIAKEQ